MMTELETDIDVMKMTPQAAILNAIFDLERKRYEWEHREDQHGVLAHINALIENLEQAQRDLDELHRIKQALAVLKSSVI